MATPYALVRLDGIESTQDEARRRFDGERPVLVVAERQTRGRGRHGRRWQAAPRAVAASMAFRPAWPAEAWPRLSLAAGLAAREALGGRPALAWPNDLLLEDGKLGGILVEADPQGIVAGLGANLWWPDLPRGFAALHMNDPGPEAGTTIARSWAEALLARVAAGPDGWGLDEYRRACVTLGREITWEPEGSGTATGIDATGALLVDTSTGSRRLLAGEVRSVRGARDGPRRADSDPYNASAHD